MKAIETTVLVTADGKATLQLPPDVLPGEHRIVLVIDEQQVLHEPSTQEPTKPGFPVIHVGSWTSDLPLRREEIYGDNGR